MNRPLPNSPSSRTKESLLAVHPANVTRLLLTALFWICLAGILFFALRPSPHGERLTGLPGPLAVWVALNDGGSNFIAFATLGWLGLVADWLPLDSANSPGRRGANRHRLITLLLLVPLLELVQLGIPGRVFDWKDIVAGTAGLLVAWGTGRWLRLESRLNRPGNGPAPPATPPTQSSTPAGSETSS